MKCKHENYDLEPTGTYDSGVLNIPIRCADCNWTGLVEMGQKVWDGAL